MGRWLRAAVPILDAVLERGRPVIVVGGTGLYFRALTEGLAEIPEPPFAMRKAASETYDERGEEHFRIGLAHFDPEAEARIAPATSSGWCAPSRCSGARASRSASGRR